MSAPPTAGPRRLPLLPDWLPDVAILDLLMPKMDGVELADRLCAESKRRPLLVALSGTTRRDLWQRAGNFEHCFFKPIDPCVLAEVLKQYAAAQLA